MVLAKDILAALDDGHGLFTPGKRTPQIPELGRYIPENEFNRAVVKYLDEELKRCGFRTLLVAPTDADTSLADRVNLANAKGADAYISIHYNAVDGKFDGNDPEGQSIHIYPGSKTGRKLAECIHKHLIGGTAQKDRGIQENDFYVLRKSNMPAILSENGFMDNKREALLMVNPAFQLEVAVEHAKGICDYFGVPYVPAVTAKPANATAGVSKTASEGTYYRVVTGSFKSKEEAEARKEYIQSKLGIDSFLLPYKP